MTLEDELEKASRETTPDVDQLGKLGQLVTSMMKLQMQIAEQENLLAGLKRDYGVLAVGQIPSLMAEMGLSEVRTQEGARIVVAREVYCKFVEGQKDNGLAWLEKTNQGAIIKHEVTVEFGKGSEREAERAVAALKDAGFSPQNIVDVHPMTLKAWARRRVEEGEEIPASYFNVNTFNIAKVKS